MKTGGEQEGCAMQGWIHSHAEVTRKMRAGAGQPIRMVQQPARVRQRAKKDIKLTRSCGGCSAHPAHLHDAPLLQEPVKNCPGLPLPSTGCSSGFNH